MDLGILETMEAPELREYLRHLLWHYRVVDGYWFLCAEKKFGREAAEYLDGAVWEKIASMAARDLVDRFKITERGIKGLHRALELLPWTMIVGYRLEEREGELFLQVPE